MPPLLQEDMTGKRYGKLVVIGNAPDRYHGKRRQRKVCVLCQCDCGRQIEVLAASLRSGNTTSCRCKWRKLDPNREEQFWLRVTYPYRSDAKRRGLDFRLTDEQSREMLQKNCAYCGAPPQERSFGKGSRKRSGLSNGIDRVNNKLGYSMLNCVPCCAECNMAKKTRSAEGFVDHCQRVSDYYAASEFS